MPGCMYEAKEFDVRSNCNRPAEIGPPKSCEMNLYFYGFESCEPGHSVTLSKRDMYILHVIRRGRGIYRTGKTVYRLGTNDCFLISPQTVSAYQADRDDPWEYFWFSFDGAAAEYYLNCCGISPEFPVLSGVEAPYFEEIYRNLCRNNSGNSLYNQTYASGQLYLLFAYLLRRVQKERPEYEVSIKTPTNDYVRASIQFIYQNCFSPRLRVDAIAEYVGLERSYFTKLFRNVMGTSPWKYIVGLRIDKARYLLLKSYLSIDDISRMVGFGDYFYFEKVFKKSSGLTPSEYRKKTHLN